MSPRLELIGKSLFANGLLADHLDDQLRALIVAEYRRLAPVRRRLTRLQMRQHLRAVRLPGPLTMTGGTAIDIVGGHEDGRMIAEYRSRLEGDTAFLSYAPSRGMPTRGPVAIIEDEALVIRVLFEQAGWRFVSPLVRAELDVIDAALAMQREAIDRFTTGITERVRRLVAEQWPLLTAVGAAVPSLSHPL